MTELTITPKIADKTARFKGAVAAGEHVAVTIKGGAVWLGDDNGAHLTLRVLDLVTGRTLAVFPRPPETLEEGDETDEWSTSSEDPNDLFCNLNLNTDRMVNAARHMLRVPVLFVMGAKDDENPAAARTLYFRDRHEVEFWPERVGDDTPYDLDRWPKQIDEWTELIAEFETRIDTAEDSIRDAVDEANGIVAHVDAAKTAAQNSATAAGDSASSAQGSAATAKNWATGGGETGDPGATNNAKYYAGQADSAKTDAAASATAAAGSATAAEAWATGGTGGTPSATNNAKYYAEQAADSAQDAEEALEDKADKVASATNGNFAGLDANGNLTDSGKKATDFAPATDIEKTALASDVQTSLGKADSAVQPSDILSDNKIKTALLPSFVDDVLEFSALANFPATGETGKIYVAKDTNKIYRWSGISYVEISASLALGETSSTAYRGDRGKAAYDHATDPNRLTTAKVSGLYKIATTAEGHVKSVTAVEKSDITALGIPAQDTTYTLPPATATTLGGVKQGTGCEIASDGTLNVTGGGSGTVDDTVTRASGNPVKSSGIWSAIWGTLSDIPRAFTSLYDYCMGWFIDAESIAPLWLNGGGATYHVGDLCVESRMDDASGRLYRCKKEYYADSESNGPSHDTEHWEPIDVTTLIAGKQDALSAAQLVNIAAVPGKANAADLRYRIAEAEYSASIGTAGGYILADRTVNIITAYDQTSLDIEVPDEVYEPEGVQRARDFLLDVDNSINGSDLALEFTGLGVDYAFVPLEDDSVSEMMTIGAGKRVRLYFTETSYFATGASLPIPVIQVARVTLGYFVTSTTPASQGGN